MPKLDEMLRSFGVGGSEYYTFYLRGMLNALTPEFAVAGKRVITEDDVSGEYLETLRIIADRYAKNLPEGQSVTLGYQSVRDVFGVEGNYYKDFNADTMADVINNTLGKFKIRKQDGQLMVDHDPYDFPREFEARFKKQTGKEPNIVDYISEGFSIYQKEGLEGKGLHDIAHLGGEYFMGDTSDDEDKLKVAIKIPQSPPVIDVDYDDPIPEEAEELVLRGPMTNKRKNLFDSFMNMFSTEAQAAEEQMSMSLPQSKPEMGDRGEPEVDIPVPTSKPQQPQQQTFFSQIRNRVRESREVM
jgi:hypothetical protein|tara:strand:+ start:453 stop:1352 length:900 start_codon:yes stop_codon:yes gene_type:complete